MEPQQLVAAGLGPDLVKLLKRRADPQRMQYLTRKRMGQQLHGMACTEMLAAAVVAVVGEVVVELVGAKREVVEAEEERQNTESSPSGRRR